MAYTEKDGYTIEDLLQFGYGHVAAARALFEDDPAFLDSAGYLAHLGVELGRVDNCSHPDCAGCE